MPLVWPLTELMLGPPEFSITAPIFVGRAAKHTGGMNVMFDETERRREATEEM
jgi:hypothetical protein